MNLAKYFNFTVEERSLKKHQRRLGVDPSQSSVLDEEKQLQSIASMLFLTPLWSFCILPSLGRTTGNNGRRSLKLENCSWSLELMSKLQAKAECANQQHP
jgi:hypothetical protein